MMSINYTSRCCELSNPPKKSPKCIHNSTVHNEAITVSLGKFKRKLLNLFADSSKQRSVLFLLLLLSSA